MGVDMVRVVGQQCMVEQEVLVMVELKVTNLLVTKLLPALTSQLVTRPQLKEELQHIVQQLDTRVPQQVTQATRQTAAQVATSKHLQHSTRGTNSNLRVVATHKRVEDQATSNHRDTNRLEGINLVVRVVMAAARAVEVDTKVVGIKVMVDAVVVDMDSKALPMDKEEEEEVAMEEEEAVAEEVADRVDTIVIWVMVTLLEVDSKIQGKSMKQIRFSFQIFPLRLQKQTSKIFLAQLV